jgi:hypothetical protein
VHQIVGEKNGLKKTAARNITENSQPCEYFLLYFHTILAIIVQETNRYVQQDANKEINQIFHILSK